MLNIVGQYSACKSKRLPALKKVASKFFLIKFSYIFDPSMSVQPQSQSCPACFSLQTHPVFICRDYSISGESFGVQECEQCTLRFTTDVPPEADCGRYYDSPNYISHTNTTGDLTGILYRAVRRFTLSEKRRILQKVTGLPIGTILDVGCGTGTFANTMRLAGWDVTGTEPNWEARQQAILRFKINALEPEAIFGLPEGKYDVITMWHVLEHVYPLHQYLQQLHKLLKPKGKLVIAVPNYTSTDARHYGKAWAAYDVPRHLYHFSPLSLQKLAHRHKFKIVRIRAMYFDAFYIALLSEQYRTGRKRYLRAFWQGLRTTLHSLFNQTVSSSVMYVLQKD